MNYEIIQMAKSGNEDAMFKIYNKYKPFIFSRTYKYFVNEIDREDMVQEAMIALGKAVNSYDETKEASFKTYAITLIDRHLISYIRKINTKKSQFFRSAMNSGVDVYGPYGGKSESDIDTKLIAREILKDYRNYIMEKLSSKEKEVLRLLLKRYNCKEISAELKCDVKSIDNTVQRIRKKSKNWIEKKYY